jgi:hypothetical protein
LRCRRFGITALAGFTVVDTEVLERTAVSGADTEGCAALKGETGSVNKRGTAEYKRAVGGDGKETANGRTDGVGRGCRAAGSTG